MINISNQQCSEIIRYLKFYQSVPAVKLREQENKRRSGLLIKKLEKKTNAL